MRGSTGFVKPLLFILIALCVVAVVAFVAAGMMGGDRDLGSAVDFTAVDQKGESFTLSKRFGVGGTALIFFDRTSGDAKTLIENLSAAKKDTSVCTVLVAKGEKDSKEVEKYLKDASLSVDVILPDEKGEIFEKYNVSACPITYFINKEGSVRAVSLSSLNASAAAKYIGYIK